MLKVLLASSILATRPVHINILDLITLLGISVNSTNYEVPHDGAFSTYASIHASLLGSNVRLKILFSSTHSLHSFFDARDHVSQPHSTTASIIVLYGIF